MATSPSTAPNKPHPIHPIHRFLFLWLEPLLALGGALQVLLSPLSYTAIAHPLLHAHLVSLSPSSSSSAAAAPYHSSSLTNQLHGGLFTIIAGGWLIMFFDDAVTLRVFERDPAVWRCVLAAHLCSDLCYLAALAHDVGGWARAGDVRVWGRGEWMTNGLTLPFLVAKVAVLLGWGVDCGGRGGKGGKVKRR